MAISREKVIHQEELALVGREREVQLPGESPPRVHGVLTHTLIQVLEQADPVHTRLTDLESFLGDALSILDLLATDDAKDRLLFASPALSTAVEMTQALEQQDLRQIIDTLEKVIARKESQDDYWPEGRLNVGIAYAALGDHPAARRWLEEAVAILSGRGLAEDGYQMAI